MLSLFATFINWYLASCHREYCVLIILFRRLEIMLRMKFGMHSLWWLPMLPTSMDMQYDLYIGYWKLQENRYILYCCESLKLMCKIPQALFLWHYWHNALQVTNLFHFVFVRKFLLELRFGALENMGKCWLLIKECLI